ncbi:MFS transporter [Haloglycomyces albus]|uniref:MFS transporter n=1 Tax=Haloglycomyces albus TaxID=526067 RepID=UPI00046D124C|nr:MFS transporter [Haloglycomyces albus]
MTHPQVKFSRFSDVLSIPGFKSLLLGGLLIRLPYSAAGLTLTLFVRFALDLSYIHAGFIGTLYVLGQATGSTLMGRISDRWGLRTVIGATTVISTLTWLCIPLMSYGLLVTLAFPAGVLAIPVFVVVRQPIAAMIPDRLRRTAYAMDSMLVELAFAIAPAAATVLATAMNPFLTPVVVGLFIFAAGGSLWLINPPTVSDAENQDISEKPVPLKRRDWLNGRLVAMMFVGMGLTIAVAGTDIAIVSLLEHHDQLNMAWMPLALWALYSLTGVFVLASTDRLVSPTVLLITLALMTVPLGFTGSWWLLTVALLPAGFLTSMTVASSTDRVSRLAPPQVRGTAMGMQGSAMTIGAALGAPLVGSTVEIFGAEWGFTAAGLGTLLAGLSALGLEWRARNHAALEPRSTSEKRPSETVSG